MQGSRKKKHQDHFAGLAPSRGRRNAASELQFCALGLPASIFENPNVAEAIHNGQHLQSHPADASVLVDRYDARLLLDWLSQFPDDGTDEGGVTRQQSVVSKDTHPSDDETGRSSESSSSSSESGGEDDEQALQRERFRDLRFAQRADWGNRPGRQRNKRTHELQDQQSHHVISPDVLLPY